MTKEEAYKKLVEKRKECSLCKDLRNPSLVEQGRYDQDDIGPWSLWQGNLNSNLVVVGQDWGGIPYFSRWEGRDQPSGNPTNENLKELLKIVGIEIRNPREQQDQIVFLTNLVLCLKKGGLQDRVEDQWFVNCASAFFKPLLEIMNPKVVIALGKKASDSILGLYGIPYSKSAPFRSIVERSPYSLSNTVSLFPVYHCGVGSVNRNRPMLQQREDWLKIGKWLQNKGFR
jgi:DNA polymerase